MKLISLLEVMDDGEVIELLGYDAPIAEWRLFYGEVFQCKEHGEFCNGTVVGVVSGENYITVMVDMEYQKRKAKGEAEK